MEIGGVIVRWIVTSFYLVGAYAVFAYTYPYPEGVGVPSGPFISGLSTAIADDPLRDPNPSWAGIAAR